MTAGLADNEPVDLDWMCFSITFNNIYISGRGWVGGAVFAPSPPRAERQEPNKPDSLIMYTVVTHLVSLIMLLD